MRAAKRLGPRFDVGIIDSEPLFRFCDSLPRQPITKLFLFIPHGKSSDCERSCLTGAF
jgi:hypothetical protein